MLYVKNTNSFVFKSRYDGVDYDFPINERVPISPEAAAHIFGFGVPEKMEHIVKHGWCRSTDKVQDGMNILNRFVFTQDEPLPTDPVDEMINEIPTFQARRGRPPKQKNENVSGTESATVE